MKGRTMNPLIQRNRQLQYLFIALLLVGLAIMQSAMGEPLNRIRNKPSNHPEFRVKLDQNVPCAFGNERVQLNGTLQLHFETINGRPSQAHGRKVRSHRYWPRQSSYVYSN